MEVGIEVDGFVFFSTGVMRFFVMPVGFGQNSGPRRVSIENTWEAKRHTEALRGFVREPVLFQPSEQNYYNTAAGQPERFVQDHPGVLTPKMEKECRWKSFLPFYGPHPTAYRILVPQPTSPAMEV